MHRTSSLTKRSREPEIIDRPDLDPEEHRFALSSLATRIREPEIMDRPDLDPKEHRIALGGLARLNRFSGSAGVLWPAVLAATREVQRPLRVLDLATGGGDIPLELLRRARQFGLTMDVLGVDCSPRAVEIARQRAKEAGASIRFEVIDVLSAPLPDGFDIVTASLFLHHLEQQQAIVILAKMAQAARRTVLVNDLVRSRGNLLLVALGARLLTRSRVVWTDASLSVRAAFTARELSDLAGRAGLHGAEIRRRFPCRMLLQWRKP